MHFGTAIGCVSDVFGALRITGSYSGLADLLAIFGLGLFSLGGASTKSSSEHTSMGDGGARGPWVEVRDENQLVIFSFRRSLAMSFFGRFTAVEDFDGVGLLLAWLLSSITTPVV